jgi:hypothetical protein
LVPAATFLLALAVVYAATSSGIASQEHEADWAGVSSRPAPGFEVCSGVVYATRTDRTEVWWQDIDSRGRVLLYTSRGVGAPAVPDQLGYLPSPDGAWLLLWDGLSGDKGAEAGDSEPHTYYYLISLPAGRQTLVGVAEGTPWLLPYWLDNGRVLLEGDIVIGGESDTAMLDVGSGKLSEPLPDRRCSSQLELPMLAERIETARLIAYCHRHFMDDLTCLYQTGDLRTAAKLPRFFLSSVDPPEFVITRGMGLPLRRVLAGRRGQRTLYPSAACSPNRALIAVAQVGQQEGDGPGDGATMTGKRKVVASLDVLGLAGGATFGEARRLAEATWEGWEDWRASREEPFPLHVPELAQPYFADTRWSRDGRLLVFTFYGYASSPEVVVLRTDTWREILRVRNATNAFVLSRPAPATGMTRPTAAVIRP